MLNLPYLSIQEMVEKTETQRKQIAQTLDSYGSWHPESATLFTEQKPDDVRMIQNSLAQIPLAEFLAKSGTTGIGGAAYLVPDAMHAKIEAYALTSDICPLISATMVNGWKGGGSLKVDILDDEGYKAKEFSSGATMHTEDIAVKQATLTPKSFGIAPRITGDLIEDNAFDLVDYHLKKAAIELGRKASDLAVTVMKTAADGWGTVNSSATGDADETKWTGGVTADIEDAKAALTDDYWIGNTMLVTTEAWEHSLSTTRITLASNIPLPYNMTPAAAGFDLRIDIPPLDVKFYNGDSMHDVADLGGALTACATFVFDRNNALLTGRKRWLQFDNYADPVKDIAGMTITCRQDSVSLYNDSIYVLTET
jgi:hypothetical protein